MKKRQARARASRHQRGSSTEHDGPDRGLTPAEQNWLQRQMEVEGGGGVAERRRHTMDGSSRQAAGSEPGSPVETASGSEARAPIDVVVPPESRTTPRAEPEAYRVVFGCASCAPDPPTPEHEAEIGPGTMKGRSTAGRMSGP